MDGWDNFFVAMAGASVAFAGLVELILQLDAVEVGLGDRRVLHLGDGVAGNRVVVAAGNQHGCGGGDGEEGSESADS
mgnify:CR=1 FL=1